MAHLPSQISNRRRWPSFGGQVGLAMLLGLGLGLLARETGGEASWLGEVLTSVGALFVQLLKAIVPPLIFTAVVASIGNLGRLENAGRLVMQTLLWFALTAAASVSLGLLVGTFLEPGTRAGVDTSLATAPHVQGSWADFLKGLVPSNMFGLQANTTLGTDQTPTTSLSFNALQILVLSAAVGVAALKSGETGAAVLRFSQVGLTIVRKLLGWVIKLTPLGTVGLVGSAVATYGWASLAPLGWFVIAVYLGLGLVLFGLYPLLLKLNGLSVGGFFKAAWPAIQLGFVSRSSMGTMPVTEEVTTERLGVRREYAAFAVPLAATTKMDGCASIYPAIAALFIAQFYGIVLGAPQLLLIAFVSVAGSAATAGVTGATVMLTLTLSTLGLPLEGAGLLLAIDPILDMGRTAVNVAGQALVPLLVAKREGMLNPLPTKDVPGEASRPVLA